MTKRLRGALVWGVAAMLAAQPCWGWGEVGHHVVGRIAAALLTPAAQKKVAAILDVDNNKTAVAAALADAAQWPDSVAREEYPQSREWHYIDLGVKPNPTLDNPLWTDPHTAFAKIVKFFGTVKGNTADELEPGSDLKFLAHLMGDVHQPLHAATNKDRGGNCLFIKFEKDEGGISAKTKLHSAWDTAMLQDRLGTDDRAIARHLVRDWKSMSQTAQTAMIKPVVGGGDGKAAVRAWIEESHGLAVTQVYGTLRPVVAAFDNESTPVVSNCSNAAPALASTIWRLDDTAVEDASQFMERQLIKAGARLAALLNAAAN